MSIHLRSIPVVLAFVVGCSSREPEPSPPAPPGELPFELVGGTRVAAHEVLVKLRPSFAPAALSLVGDVADAAELAGVGAPALGLYRVRSHSLDAGTLVAELAELPEVEYAEPNYLVHTTAVPNDARFGELWGLRNTGQVVQGRTGTPGADISATKAWDLATGSAAIVVAVVDTGVDYNHPDLAANVWSAPDTFTVTIGGQSIRCPRGSHGFNALTNSCDPLDDHNHGTHCSGTIGGVGNNGEGVAGVNWTTSIMGAKFLNASGQGSTADAIDAIEFAIQAKQAFPTGANVRILSNSWGGDGFSQALRDQIVRAGNAGMLFVAAAGNNGSDNDTKPFYPAGYGTANLIAVAATGNQEDRASFSNFGATTVHLGAPGLHVLSTVRNGGYQIFSGTSMATPHVSGALALVMSACPIDSAGARSALLANVDPTPAMAGITITGGRLNVDKALRSCIGPFTAAVAPASRSIAPGASTTYTVTVTPRAGFTDPVSLAVTGIPAGATATFAPSSLPGGGTSTLTIATSTSSPLGTFALAITAAGGGHQATATAALELAPPDFAIAASPASRAVNPGQAAIYTVDVASVGGFAGTVGLAATGLPAGATASFTPSASVTAPGQATLTVTTGAGTPEGTFALTITGTSGGVQHAATVTLVVQIPDFRMTVTPDSKTVKAGFPALFYTVKIRSQGGFAGTVAFTVTGLPAGASADLDPVTVSPETPESFDLMSVATSRTTPPGTYALKITGRANGIVKSRNVTLIVTP